MAGMKRITTVLFCILAGCFFANAQSGIDFFEAESIMKKSTYEILSKKGNASSSRYKDPDVSFALKPETPLNCLVESNWIQQEKPVFVVENLYLLSKKDLDSDNKNLTNIEYASKVIRSVSKLEGITYYSNFDKKKQVLYKNAYRIPDEKNRIRLEDDLDGNAGGKTIYAMLDDHSFGKANYKVSYKQTKNEVSAVFINVSPLYMGPVKAISSENLIIDLVITDCGEDFVVYLVVRAKFPALSILESTMYDSLSSRLDAIFNWFVIQF